MAHVAQGTSVACRWLVGGSAIWMYPRDGFIRGMDLSAGIRGTFIDVDGTLELMPDLPAVSTGKELATHIGFVIVACGSPHCRC